MFLGKPPRLVVPSLPPRLVVWSQLQPVGLSLRCWSLSPSLWPRRTRHLGGVHPTLLARRHSARCSGMQCDGTHGLLLAARFPSHIIWSTTGPHLIEARLLLRLLVLFSQLFSFLCTTGKSAFISGQIPTLARGDESAVSTPGCITPAESSTSPILMNLMYSGIAIHSTSQKEYTQINWAVGCA